MNTLAHDKTVRRALAARAGTLALLAAVTAVLAVTHGCNQGQQGDRCNPTLALANNPYGADDDECGSGLTCQQPALCPENYCCPTSGPITSPFCMTGCNGGQASICDAGGDADCASLGDGG